MKDELEILRKVAEAALGWEILSSVNDKFWNLRFRLLYPPGQNFVDLDDALALIDGIGSRVKTEKDAALAEYREFIEATALLSRPVVSGALNTVEAISNGLTEESAARILATAAAYAGKGDEEC